MSRRIKITGVKELKAALDGNVLKFPKEVNDIVHKHGARLQNQTQSNMDRAYIRAIQPVLLNVVQQLLIATLNQKFSHIQSIFRIWNMELDLCQGAQPWAQLLAK